MRDIGELISFWQEREATLPRLTWYGEGDERVELSGRVLANWVVKAANLLTEEADAPAGVQLLVDLPVHWRALVWALGGWLSGAQVQFGARIAGDDPQADDAQVVVCEDPHDSGGEVLIAVALPALAMAFDGDLPPGAVDGAADLMTYPDELMQPPAPVDLTAMAHPLQGGQEAPRVLLQTAGTAGTTTIGRCLGIWLAGGSVILTAGAADPEHLATVEEAQLW